MVATSPSSDRPDGFPPPVLWLAAGMWALGMGAMVASGIATRFEPLTINVLRAVLMAILGWGFSLALWRLSTVAARPRWAILALGMGVLAATTAHTLLDLQVDRLLHAWLNPGAHQRRILSDSVLRAWVMLLIAESHVVIFATLYAFFGMASTILRSAAETREREAQLAAARTLAVSAQLAMLRHQLNPHFIFNTLNAIASLVAMRRSDDAEAMIGRLSDFLRASLGVDARPLATLDDEMTTLQNYLDIEAVRFGARLRLAYDLEPGLGNALIPSFLLQPLVENAVKHAVSPALGPVDVRVSARQAGNDLVVSVADSGAGGANGQAAGTGTGLRNVRERLALLYGDRASLAAGARGEGFMAAVRVPLRRAEDDA
ncbi:MAG: histidine kinase [Phenylobacterium sp.]|uniref:sensor histidine kinase n=1 Tax=Phenylobacterium sp. TaxID=1871053 RepID=UPI001A1EEDA9|nr:histidine kinase [Phenylobacterium sp.]MBJ7409835.1 histidine kinase [Phenylobacterium sp.]